MTDSITQLDGAENMNEGDTNQHVMDKIGEHNLSKTGGDAGSGGGDAGSGSGDTGSGGGDAYSDQDVDKRSQDDDCDVMETKQRRTSTQKQHIKSGDAGSGGGDAGSGGGDAGSGGGDAGSGGGDADSDQGVDKRSQDEDCDVTETKQRPKSSQENIKRLNTQQPEDNVTNVHKQQKENTAEVGVQSHLDQEDLDTTDRKCIKVRNENYEVLHAGEDGSRLRTPKKKQNLAHLGKDDIRRQVETKRSPVAANTFSWHILLATSCILLAFYFAVLQFLGNPSPSVQKQYNLLEVFEQEIVKVQASFPRQHRELWRRSKIHLKRHLNLTDPTEPVSVILTSGREAEKTLGCLAQRLAAAFSNALNSSVLSIDGSSKSVQNSDDVKLEIDIALKEAFEGGTKAAVIHRFEALPPGSTLIFYRYCDHENSAFKKVFLAFTVMLQEELAFPPNVSLGLVEEVVQEYLKEKFVSSDRTTKFNRMDIDKLSGLWSRISHLILPVTAEQKIEQHGCQT